MKQTPKQRIAALAKTLPTVVPTRELTLAEQLAPILEQIAKIQAPIVNIPASVVNVPESQKPSVVVTPNITIPEIKIPPANNVVNVSIPEIKIPPANITVESNNSKGVNKWEFTIHRLDNGLMDSVTAERVG